MGSLLAVVLGVIFWCIYLFIPLIHVEFTLTRTGDEIRIEGGGYETEFITEEIKSVEILQKEIGESFHRKNGLSSDEYQIGHFKGSESGETMLFLCQEVMPILKIKLEDRTIFLNSREKKEIKIWYDQCAVR